MRKQKIYGLLGFLALFSLSLFSAGLPFLQAEEISYLEEEISYERVEPMDPIDIRERKIREIIQIIILFILAVLGFAIILYFLLRRPSLRKGVIMGIVMIPFVILIIYLASWVGSALGYHRLWRGVDIEAIFFIMGAFIILLITPIMFLIVHKKDSRKPEEQKRIFTNSALIGAKKGGIISLGLSVVVFGKLLQWLSGGRGISDQIELPLMILLSLLFIALLIIFIKVPLRKILDIFIPLYLIPLFFIILPTLLSMMFGIEPRYLIFLLLLSLLMTMISGLIYLGILIGTFSGYIIQKKRTKIFTKSDGWITGLFVSLIPLTLVSLIFTIFILMGPP